MDNDIQAKETIRDILPDTSAVVSRLLQAGLYNFGKAYDDGKAWVSDKGAVYFDSESGFAVHLKIVARLRDLDDRYERQLNNHILKHYGRIALCHGNTKESPRPMAKGTSR